MAADSRNQENGSGREPERRMLEIVAGLAAELRPGAGIAPSDLEASFDRDIGLDSLSRVELVARVEAAFGVALPESVIGLAETPRDLLRAVAAAGGEGTAAAPAPTSLAPGPVPVIEAVGGLLLPHRAATLLDVLGHYADARPEAPHIRFYADDGNGDTITYGALHEDARRVAAGLLARGFEPGHAAILMLPTGPDYFLAFFGVLMAGGIPVPIYPPARPTQIEEHLRRHARLAANAGARAMITTAEARPLGRLLGAQTESLRTVVTVADLVGPQADGSPPLPAASAGDIAFLQYTSGSTGQPKGVALTHANLLANVRAMGQALEVTVDDVLVSWLPLYHDMGLIGAWLGSLYHGVPLVLMSPLAFLGRPLRWLTAISRHRGTISAGPNFAYEMCVRRIPDADLAGLDLSSWRVASNGAEPVSPATLRRFIERFEPCGFRPTAMMPMFGLAENCVGLAFPPMDRGPRIDRVRRASLMASGLAEPAGEDEAGAVEFVACGRPIPGHEIRIADEARRELPERREGRLQFRGPSATAGYYRNAEATRELVGADGWLDSGDRAYIADGDLFVTGRIKDVIIRAGRNIHPAEIEDAVGEIDGVRKGAVAVFGTAGPEAGTERLVVLAETRRRDDASLERIRADVNGLVADLIGAPPDDVVLAPPNTVPKTSSGKIRRAASREAYEKGLIGKARRAVWLQAARLALAGTVPTVRRAWRSVSEAAYAAWFWAVLGLVAVFVWPGVVAAPTRGLRWAIAHRGSRLVLGLTGLSPRLRGAEHLPAEGVPHVLASNHMSYLDGCVMVATLARPVAFVAKAELASQWVAGTFLSRLGAVFVERFDAARGAADARRLIDTASGDIPLFYFPEGTLQRAPGLLPFQMGAFSTAARADLPIVPLAVRGTRNVLRDQSWRPRRGRISVSVDEAVMPPGGESDAWKRAIVMREEVRRRILRLCGEPDLVVERSPVREMTGNRP